MSACVDLEIDRDGHVHAQRLAVVVLHDDVHAVLQVIHGVVQHFGVQRDLIVGGGVHEVIQIAVVIQILHLPVFDADVLHAVARLERLFKRRARADVAHLGADGGVAPARLVVRVFQHAEEPAIQFKRRAFAEIVYVDHSATTAPDSV